MYNERPDKICKMRHTNAHGGVANLEKMKTTRDVRSCLKASLGSACSVYKDSYEVVYREN